MTAPLLNASTIQPTGAAGAAAGLFGAGVAAATQGPMAGFEALLAAFFGPGAGEPVLGADGKPLIKTPGAAKDAKAAADGKDEAATTETTATPSTDAQILAALLAQPIVAPDVVETAPAGDTAEATPAAAPGPAFAPQLPDAAALLAKTAQPAQPAKSADGKPLDAKALDAAVAAAQAGADADATGEVLDAKADAALPGAATVTGAAGSALDDGKPAAARQPATAAAPPPEAPAAPRPQAPPPVAMTAVATAAAAPPPAAPVAETAEAPTDSAPVIAATEAAATEAEAAPATPAAAAPRAKAGARAARNETGARTESAAAPMAGDADPLKAAALAPTEAAATFESGSDGKREEAAPAVEAKADADTGQPAAPNVADAAATASTSAPAEVRAGPQTVAHLAAQIVKKLEGRSTQFDVALNPEGLGRVDVRIEIGAQGKLTASMAFENPQAAGELRARAGELQKALEQAGFDISGGIRFDVAADRGQGQAGQGPFGQDAQNNGGAWRGKAFQAALDSADQTADAALSGALNLQRRTLMSGVDVRI